MKKTILILLGMVLDTSRAGGLSKASRRGRSHTLLVIADSIHKPPASTSFGITKHVLAVMLELFQLSPAEPVAYEWSWTEYRIPILPKVKGINILVYG